LTLARGPRGSARVVVFRLLMVVALLSCAGSSAAANGATDARTPAGWVAYVLEGYDQQLGDAYSWISVLGTDGRAGPDVSSRPQGEHRYDLLPAWSANGRLAFVRSLPRSTDLLVAGPASWQVQSVNRSRLGSDSSVLFGHPVWSPDGGSIAWQVRDLFVVDVRRHTRVKVAGSSCAPRWSPNGRELLYLAGDCNSISHRRIEVVRVDGGGRRVVARGRIVAADWSPDGRRIAYAMSCFKTCGVLVTNADGSRTRDVPLPLDSIITWVRWIAPSTIVAGGSFRGRVGHWRVGLLRINLDRATARPLARGVVFDFPEAPVVTADGSLGVLAITGRRRGSPALIDVGSGKVKWGEARAPFGWRGDGALAFG
jgi:hypothetical protein